jgi:glutathione S-transferase
MTNPIQAPLTLYLHPLASYCWKVLIALYENDTPFRPQIVATRLRVGADPRAPARPEASPRGTPSRGGPRPRPPRRTAVGAALQTLWPLARFPVLRDEARERIVPESTIIIEYLSQHYPGRVALLPADPEAAREVRLADRFYDLYVHQPMQTIVGDRLHPAEARDPHGVARARGLLDVAYGMIERDLATRRWAVGEAFTMADCAAAPALHYADRVHPLGDRHPRAAAYLRRLEARSSFARVRAEAAPYDHLFPTG